MKILYLCSDVDVQVLGHQGCSVHIREFTNALVDAGHDVLIVCNWLGDSVDIQTRARVHHLQPEGYDKLAWDSLYDDPEILNHFLERDLYSLFWNAWLQPQIPTILQDEKPDFIYERYALFGTGGLQLRSQFGVPLILELNAPLCDQQEGYQKFPLIETARRLEPEIVRAADAVVALTPWLFDWAVELGADPSGIHILPDAVSGRLFARRPEGTDVRREYQLADHQVVGFVGSFHKWHDVAGLIEAFQQLVASHPRRRLLLVGDGHDRPKLEQQVNERGLADQVIFAGKVAHENVPNYLAAMDVAVVAYQPTDDFCFSPMKLFESMAAGCPTVAARLGQIADVVTDGETGKLYTPGDVPQMAAAIAALLDDRENATRMGAAAREHVLRNHTWGQVTSRVVQIAQNLRAE